MTRSCILAIDQGTTNSKASLVDASGNVLVEASQRVNIRYPQPGWVEQDPTELWRTSLAAMQQVLEHQNPDDIAAVAITNQRESTLIWDRKTGAPLGPCVSWQCRRSELFIAELRRAGHEMAIRKKTGLTLDPMFSAGKARWLLDSIPDGHARARSGDLCFGTVDSWLLWNLSGGQVHACDVTNASRTQLFNLNTADWDDELLDLFGLPRAMMPAVHPSGFLYGFSCPAGNLPGGLPIAALIGDSHGALVGHAGFRPGSIKATYGTGSSLMMPLPSPILSEHGLSTSVAWGYQGITYALEGNIYITGAAVQWLAQFLGLKDPDEVEELAGHVSDSQGVYFVPALVGLGAPHWDPYARGLLVGITRGTTSAHVARAVIESIAFQIYDVFTAMQQDSGQPLHVLMADGGATRNRYLMQFQANILGIPVIRSQVSDLSALGAAYLAGLTTGIWQSLEQVEALPRPHERFEPQMSEAQRNSLLDGWKNAVYRALSTTTLA